MLRCGTSLLVYGAARKRPYGSLRFAERFLSRRVMSHPSRGRCSYGNQPPPRKAVGVRLRDRAPAACGSLVRRHSAPAFCPCDVFVTHVHAVPSQARDRARRWPPRPKSPASPTCLEERHLGLRTTRPHVLPPLPSVSPHQPDLLAPPGHRPLSSCPRRCPCWGRTRVCRGAGALPSTHGCCATRRTCSSRTGTIPRGAIVRGRRGGGDWGRRGARSDPQLSPPIVQSLYSATRRATRRRRCSSSETATRTCVYW